MDSFIGTGVALVTPFDSSGNIDVRSLTNLVEFQISNGIDYLVVLGTTAEAATLSTKEKNLVMKTVSLVNAGRLPLVVGHGGNNTHDLVRQFKEIDFLDYEAVLSVSPAYSKPTQEGIYQHFKALSLATPLPIIMYNVPSRTGSNMLPETTLRLANDFNNIIGIKEACGDMLQLDEILKHKDSDFHVISGDDFTALATVLAGGSGVISVLGQGLPKEFSKMITLGLRGDSEPAYEIHQALLNGMHLIFEEGNPAGIKTILQVLNICINMVRLPLVKASEDLTQRIGAFIKARSMVNA